MDSPEKKIGEVVEKIEEKISELKKPGLLKRIWAAILDMIRNKK